MDLGSLTVVDDVGPADWLVDQLESWGSTPATVASFLPDGCASYVRLLHPAYRSTGTGELRPVRWHQLARPDQPFTATTSLQDLIGIPTQTLNGSQDHAARYGVNVDPCDGDMDRHDLIRLTDILATWTSTADDVWFCIWEGYGWSELAAPGVGLPRVRLPHRDHFLCHGGMHDALGFPHGHAPTLWWPHDRAWCVSTEVDGYSTYIACGPACSQALLDDAELEILPSHLHERFTAY